MCVCDACVRQKRTRWRASGRFKTRARVMNGRMEFLMRTSIRADAAASSPRAQRSASQGDTSTLSQHRSLEIHLCLQSVLIFNSAVHQREEILRVQTVVGGKCYFTYKANSVKKKKKGWFKVETRQKQSPLKAKYSTIQAEKGQTKRNDRIFKKYDWSIKINKWKDGFKYTWRRHSNSEL